MTKQPSPERRSFLSRFHFGAASLVLLGRSARAQQVRSASPARFEPARHSQDDWMDEVPGKHRLVFDTISAAGFSDALLFASNFMLANRNDYGLQNSDLAVIIVVRHLSTAFGFNDAMWNKYSEPMAKGAGDFVDPKTKAAPAANVYSAGMGGQVTRQGVQFAVCSMATRRLAGSIAQAVKASTDEIHAELIANLVPNARMVPAGILALSRAQERGYTLAVADRMS